jgi:polysaccharide export outer membrane protein
MLRTYFVSLLLASMAQAAPPRTGTPPVQAAPPRPAPAPVQAGPARQVPTPAPSSYTIGPQDQLSITVADEPELTGKFRVDNDGSFIFPYLGRVEAGGKSLAALQVTLTRQLANGYLKNPQVRVEVDQYKSKSVFVSGEVRSPGKITMAGQSMTLLEALAQAGSPTPNASTEIVVTRRAEGGMAMMEEIRVNRRDIETGRAGQDMFLRDGDVIFVPKAQTFYISGMVRNPGSYVLDPGMTIEQAIALAGGLSERGSDRGIVANRLVKGKSAEVGVSKTDKVQAGDTIKVRARFF